MSIQSSRKALLLTLLLASYFTPAIASSIPSSSAAVAATTSTIPLRTKVSIVHEFPIGTWLENLAQRPSGHILATEFTTPKLWQVDPSKPPDQEPVLITSIPEKLGLLGITEISPDVFALVAGNFSFLSGANTAGSYSVYRIDLTRCSSSAENSSPAVITSKIANFPDAQLLNGLVFLPRTSRFPEGALLSTDSLSGTIWFFDLALPGTKSKPEIWARDPLMAGCGGTGVNGIKFDGKGNKVYFSNFNCQGGFFASIGIDTWDYRAVVGSAMVVGGKSQGVPIDDFDIDFERGVAFAAANPQDQVVTVGLKSGSLENLAGSVNSTLLANPTACRIGRTWKDKRRGLVYVTTTGGYPGGVNGKVIGGQVVAIDTKST